MGARAETYIFQYMTEIQGALFKLNLYSIKEMVESLIDLKKRKGRLFVLGIGGGAGHASHAASDFRKIAEIEAYAPTDNVSELTARINDESWETVFTQWLRVSRLNPNDVLLVFSVGGGDEEKKISLPIIRAIDYAKEIGTVILGIVGKRNGYTAKKANICVIVPVENRLMLTAHTESLQALLWHLLVSHPLLKSNEMKWESLDDVVLHKPEEK